MRMSARLLVPALGLAALAASVPAASANPICVGTQEDGVVCVEPDALPGASVQPGPGVTRCVVVPTRPGCESVTVPTYTPVVQPGGGQVVYCSGPCGSVIVGTVTGAAEPAVDLATNTADILVEFAGEFTGEVQEQHDWCWQGGVSGPRLTAYAQCMLGG